MGNQFNWKCTVDEQAREILIENIPAFKEALDEIEKDSSNKEVESRRNQMISGIRESEIELKAIDKRLNRRDWGVLQEGEEEEILGYNNIAAFVATSRV